MSEDTESKPPIEQLPILPNRRHFLGAAGILVGGTILDRATGALTNTWHALTGAFDALNLPNADQRLASQMISNPETPRAVYRVLSNKDTLTNHGANINTYPIPKSSGDTASLGRLLPGAEIEGIIYPGKNPKNIGRQGQTTDWVAFINNQGKVGFVAIQNLEEKPK